MMIKYWLLAMRPKTLTMAIMPVLTGTVLAWHEQHLFDPLPLVLALLAALLIQIGTNLHNDAADYERGVDTAERLGPKRAVAQGWLSAKKVKAAALASFVLALVCGIYLVWLGGWPILLAGLFSLAAAFLYSGGTHPVAYSPLGEVFVLIFFGIIAVAGSYYLQAIAISGLAVVAGIIIGLPAAAVLLVNNYRDLDTDVKAGRRTLVSIIGRKLSCYIYAVLLILPIILAPLLTTNPIRMLSWFALPAAIYLIRKLFQNSPGLALNSLLAQTAQYQVLLSVLLMTSLLFLR
ncbi:MAG: 1,4-dihydroxy-2-naphthoate polyprenyltransferase [Gammaproteobacteria bacterium]|nr:1,4-dihydroxy-2-naphthoate polyprenyltransferase [Gammaproteobacteria bacterium]